MTGKLPRWTEMLIALRIISLESVAAAGQQEFRRELFPSLIEIDPRRRWNADEIQEDS